MFVEHTLKNVYLFFNSGLVNNFSHGKGITKSYDGQGL